LARRLHGLSAILTLTFYRIAQLRAEQALVEIKYTNVTWRPRYLDLQRTDSSTREVKTRQYLRVCRFVRFDGRYHVFEDIAWTFSD